MPVRVGSSSAIIISAIPLIADISTPSMFPAWLMSCPHQAGANALRARCRFPLYVRTSDAVRPTLARHVTGRLRTSKANGAVVLAAFTLAWFASNEFGFLAVLVVLVALAVFEWLTVRVSLED